MGNSPLNFTDPSGYCFMGCFWKPAFKAIGNFFRQNWGSLFQITATAVCTFLPGCQPFLPLVAGLSSAFVTGVSSGNLGQALKAGLISAVTALAFQAVGDLTGDLFGIEQGVLDPTRGGHGPLEFMSEAHRFNMAGHALVGCASAVASGGKCGQGALSAAAGSFATPLTEGAGFFGGLVITSTAGGLASVAGGGKFGNGAVTAAYGYLFNHYRGKIHDQVRDEAAQVLRLNGWVVATEVPLAYYHDGVLYETRADILAWRADRGYGVLEYKTGIDPRFTGPQEYIIPAIANGEAVKVFAGHEGNNALSAMGLYSGQLLPQDQTSVSVIYKYGVNSQPHVTWFTEAGRPYPIPFKTWRAPGGF